MQSRMAKSGCVVVDKIEIVIPLDPRTKKNNMRLVTRNCRTFPIPSKAYVEYEEACGWYLKRPDKPIDYRVNVKAVYYMKTKRKVDLPNLHSALHDILTHYGIVEDDNSDIIAKTDGSEVLYDKDNPRTEITITRLDEVK